MKEEAYTPAPKYWWEERGTMQRKTIWAVFVGRLLVTTATAMYFYLIVTLRVQQGLLLVGVGESFIDITP